VFYTQERVGKGGRRFKVIKLRSMIRGAEKNGAQWAEKDDPRVTRVGRFIRKTRIDELPQFINVLRGDMSIIGPRPERPSSSLSSMSIFQVHRAAVCQTWFDRMGSSKWWI